MKKKIIKNLKKSIVTCSVSCCASYTLVSVLLSLFSINDLKENVWVINLELFIVCFVIALLMLLSNLFSNDDMGNTKISFLVGFAEVALPVLLLGGPVFNWFDLFSAEMLSPLFILTFVYTTVFFMLYLYGKWVEKNINKKISERKEHINNDKQDN